MHTHAQQQTSAHIKHLPAVVNWAKSSLSQQLALGTPINQSYWIPKSSEANSQPPIAKGLYHRNGYHLIWSTLQTESILLCVAIPGNLPHESGYCLTLLQKYYNFMFIYVFLNGRAPRVRSASLCRWGQWKEQYLWKATGHKFRS